MRNHRLRRMWGFLEDLENSEILQTWKSTQWRRDPWFCEILGSSEKSSWPIQRTQKKNQEFDLILIYLNWIGCQIDFPKIPHMWQPWDLEAGTPTPYSTPADAGVVTWQIPFEWRSQRSKVEVVSWWQIFSVSCTCHSIHNINMIHDMMLSKWWYQDLNLRWYLMCFRMIGSRSLCLGPRPHPQDQHFGATGLARGRQEGMLDCWARADRFPRFSSNGLFSSAIPDPQRTDTLFFDTEFHHLRQMMAVQIVRMALCVSVIYHFWHAFAAKIISISEYVTNLFKNEDWNGSLMKFTNYMARLVKQFTTNRTCLQAYATGHWGSPLECLWQLDVSKSRV